MSYKATIDRIVQNATRAAGLEVRRNSARSRPDLRLAHYLRLAKVDAVFDIGANKGQFARGLIKAGYDGRIVSFEPLPGAHALLTRDRAGVSPKWEVAPRMALSNSEGEAKFFVTVSDSSSSLLEPTKSFVEALPAVGVKQEITVRTARLDDVAPDYLGPLDRLFLKLDVQGAEKIVLDGAPQTVDRAIGAMVEVCTDILYEGQATAVDILALFEKRDFDLWDVVTNYRDPETLRLGAVDFIFFSKPAAKKA